MTMCAVAECLNKRYSLSYCIKHYRRFKRWGDPEKTVSHEPPSERAKRYTEQRGSCLVWTGGISKRGYGLIWVAGRSALAHRTLWQEKHGELPPNIEIDHICHNRACVNLDHLRPVSKGENQQNRRGANAQSKTGLRGVRRVGNSWWGQARLNGVTYRTPTFGTPEESNSAVIDIRRTLFTHSEMDREVTA
jgi:hypothetical protein